MLNHKMVVLGLVIMHLNLPHSQRHSFATLIVYAAGVEAIVSIKRGFSGRCIQSPSPPSPPPAICISLSYTCQLLMEIAVH